MKISVLLCSYRLGGLDITFKGLQEQTFPRDDFEVIFIDTNYVARRADVAWWMDDVDLNVFHSYPARSRYPEDTGSMHRNSAIALAEGELCVFMCDYGYAKPDWLQRFWDHYQMNGKRQTSIAPHRYWQHHTIAEDWLTKRRWSIFADMFRPEYLVDIIQEGSDPKLQLGAGGISGNYFHMKNESVKLETLLALNGCDENYDGGHLYSDIDLGLRCEAVGNGFTLDPSNILEIVQIRDIYPPLDTVKTPEQSFDYFSARKSAWEADRAAAIAPHSLNLLEFREKELKRKESIRVS